MKILITGGNGLVGSHFVENYHPSLKSGDIILTPSVEELNITDKKSVENFFKLHKPDTIMHFAAFTDVTGAEEERNNKQALCWIVNVEGTANLIKAAGDQTYFIYISTDAVFSGNKDNPGPYDENYPTENNLNLLSWYGWTKKEGEKLIVNNLKNPAILRIANPVRVKYDGKLDYIRKILNLYDTEKIHPMFNNQYLTLTYIDEVTHCLEILLTKRLPGIYHISSTNIFTPFKLANFLIEKARGKKEVVKQTSIEGFLKNNLPRYPQYGGLKVEKTQKILKLKFNKWEETIETLAKQLSI
ncbi:MAG: sugar nucleotide-binding protein [Candidatus Daviesbacteria bacterium]|nr:sugar nucleotide-binding protein [Candidatus Daviesbacteria bacterium]